MNQEGSLEMLKHGCGSGRGRKHEKSQKGFVHLPQELWEDIYKWLVLSDQIRFGSICKPWLSIALKKPHPPVTEPWLLLCPDNIFSESECNEFRCLSDQRVYKFDKLLKDRKVVGSSSSNGWVLTTTHPQLEGREISFLVNPILNNSQITFPKQASFLLRVLLNGDQPNGFWSIKKLLVVRTRPICGDSVVTILIILFSVGRLAVLRPDASYVSMAASYDDIIFYNGKLYALESQRPGFEVHVLRLVKQTLDRVRLVHKYIVQGIVTEDHGCLVESCGDLLIITRQYDERKCLIGFEVFKLQLIDGTAHTSKLQTLGGQALLLGMDGCTSLPLGEFSIFEESHIYFIGFASESTQLGNGAYSLKDGCIKGVPYLSSIFCPRRSFWFVPTTEDRIVNLD